MSHHFAQMCACSFFLVQAVRCLGAGSCSLIVSHDRLQSLLDKVLRVKPYMEGGVGTSRD